MSAKYKYATVMEAIKQLRDKGFTVDFNLEKNALSANSRNYHKDDFEITEVYRYEGESNPDDEATVYGIESHDGVKGILVTSYGMYIDEVSEELLQKLSLK
jgi:uroporphyrinogen-III synthase